MFKNFFQLIVIIILVSSCDTPTDKPNFSETRYNQQLVYNLNISDVQIVNNSEKPSNLTSAASLLPHSFYSLVNIWVNDNIKAANDKSGHFLRVTIRKATVEERKKKDTDNHNIINYDAELDVHFEIYNSKSPMMPIDAISVTVTNSYSVPVKHKPVEHQKVLYVMQKEMMDDFNARVREQIPHYFSNMIIK